MKKESSQWSVVRDRGNSPGWHGGLMAAWLAVVGLATWNPGSCRGSTITGTIVNTSGQAISTNVLFTPLSTPLINGGTTVPSTLTNVITASDGTFAVALGPGKYKVTIGGAAKDSLLIGVPNDNATYALNALAITTDNFAYNLAVVFEQLANKGQTNGYAALGTNGLVPAAQLGTGSATTNTFLRVDGSWQTVAGGGTANAVTNLNGLGALYQTFTTGITGGDFNIFSAGTNHQFNLPNASATNRGALSAADWNTFNGKINAAAATNIVISNSIAAIIAGANIIITTNIVNGSNVLTIAAVGGGTTVSNVQATLTPGGTGATNVTVSLGTGVSGSFQYLTNTYFVSATTNLFFVQPTGLAVAEQWNVIVKQDATGNRTVNFNTAYWKFPSGVMGAATTNANAIDVFSCQTDPFGTNVLVTQVFNLK